MQAREDRQPAGFFYGWVIVAAAFLAFGMVYGSVLYSYTIFVNPIAQSFHATPAQVLLGFTLTNIGTGIFGVWAGRLLARRPIRQGMTLGLVLLALAFFGLSLSSQLWQLLAIYALVVPFGAVIVAPLGASAVVTNWFAAARGRALTLATLGTSFGQLAIPRLAASIIEGGSWQGAYQAMALLMLIAAPVMLVLVRDRPEDKGLRAYGGTLAPAAAVPAPAAGALLRHAGFWSIGVAYTCTVTVYLALVATMVPYARTYGVSAIQASELAVCMGVFAIIGKLGFAAVTDRIGLRNTFWIATALNIAAAGMLLFLPQYSILFAASACVGGSAGGILPVWPGMVAHRFGRAALPHVMGLMSPVVLCIQGLGAPFAAATHYRPAFMVFLVMLLIALLVSRNVHRDPAPA